MSITDYIENLNRIKNLAVNNWGELTETEKEVVEHSYDWLVDNLDIKKGEIIVDEDLSKLMNEFVSAVVEIVNKTNGYEAKVTSFLSDLANIKKNAVKFYETAFKFDIERAGVNDIQKAVVQEIIDQYTDNGLNVHFAAPLRDGIFRNILAGANMKQVREVLRNYILSGQDRSGKLGQYLNQTAQQAVDSYTGAINQQLAKTFTFTGYIISGSLIETSSKQCVYAVETSKHGYLSFSDWEKVLDIARNNPKAKLIEGTNIKNLPINKLHWGCRHDFTPVIMKEEKKPTVKEETKKAEVKKEIGNAKSIDFAIKETSDIFRNNLGFSVGPGSVEYAPYISLEQANARNRQLNKLSLEYNVSDALDKEELRKILFYSRYGNSTALGFVAPKDYSGRAIDTVNFGHVADPARYERGFTGWTQPKALVDRENIDISTPTHEFGHLLALQQQKFILPDDSKQQGFWDELLDINIDYHKNLKIAIEKKDTDFEEGSFLGQYASVNLNEFLAEGFMEYKLKKNPSVYALKIGTLVDKHFKK